MIPFICSEWANPKRQKVNQQAPGAAGEERGTGEWLLNEFGFLFGVVNTFWN